MIHYEINISHEELTLTLGHQADVQSVGKAYFTLYCAWVYPRSSLQSSLWCRHSRLICSSLVRTCLSSKCVLLCPWTVLLEHLNMYNLYIKILCFFPKMVTFSGKLINIPKISTAAFRELYPNHADEVKECINLPCMYSVLSGSWGSEY